MGENVYVAVAKLAAGALPPATASAESANASRTRLRRVAVPNDEQRTR